MDPITALLYETDPVIAVVGATDNLNKYGAVIYRDLKAKGFTVYPGNPTRATVQPGAEDQTVIDRLEDGPFQYLANACIMVRARAKTAS